MINDLLTAGLSIIPITMPTKRPTIPEWTTYQTRPPAIGELSYNESYAMICGKVSGNVEVIDIDIKNDSELVGKFQKAVDKFCPYIICEEFVTAQRTISGGLHLMYKCDQIGGNVKLAKNEKGEVLIETRGEGGYIVIDPTKGYDITLGKLTNIPTITTAERTELLDACRSLNKHFKPTYTPKNPDVTYGADDDTPGNAYCKRGKLEDLIGPLGWVLSHEWKGNEYWRRPDKTIGHSASWNGVTFYVWSSSTVLESERAYNLFQLRTHLLHNGDYSSCAKALATEGYGAPAIPRATKSVNGAFKEDRERKEKGEEDNKETERRHVYLTPSIKANNKFAHIFVSLDNICSYYESGATGKVSELLKQRLAEELGTESWSKIDNEGLPIFKEEWIQKDDENSIYLYFRNGTLQIFANKVVFTQGQDRSMVWQSLVLDRDYKPTDEIHEIAELARRATINYESLQIGLGYLLHRNWKRNATKIVWAVDYMPETRNDGRRGKDLFTTIVSLCRKWVPVKWKKDHNFWTSSISPDTAVVHFEDVSPFLATNDEFKKSITGDLSVELKGANISVRKFADKPKFSASSQSYPADFMDSSIRGRLWIVEFTDYLQKNPPKNVLVYEDKDLSSFDAWMVECCQVYLRNKEQLIGTPKITPEQRAQALKLKYGKSILRAVEEVRNELFVEKFITAADLLELLGGQKSGDALINKFLDAYQEVHSIKLEPDRTHVGGKRTRIYKNPQ